MREPKSRPARVVEGARVPRAGLCVWQSGGDGDVMAARLVRFAFKAPAGAGRLHGRQLPPPYEVEIRFPACVGGLARALCLGPRTSPSRTCRARWRLVA
jgi:hypothetical protein